MPKFNGKIDENSLKFCSNFLNENTYFYRFIKKNQKKNQFSPYFCNLQK